MGFKLARMKRLLGLSLFTIISVFSSSSQAAFITFEAKADRSYATCAGCQAAYESAVDTVLDSFETQVNAQAGTGDLSIDQYFGGVANSMVMAGAGTGIVYGNDFSMFIAGGGLGIGGALAAGNGIGDVISAVTNGNSVRGLIVGGALQASATVGVNAGLFLKSPSLWGLVDPSRLKGYVSFMSLNREFTGFGTASVSNFSAMGQYGIIPGKSWALNSVKWEGVNLSSGVRFGKMDLTGSYSTTVEESSTVDAGGGVTPTVTMSTPLAVDLDINSTTFAIPFEGSTAIRLGYILSLYAGMGVDLAFGSTSGGVTGTDDLVTVTHSGTGAGSITGNTEVNYSVDAGFANGSGKPAFLNARGFAGAQLELGVVNLTLGLQKALFAGRYAVNLGANLYW